MTDPQTQPPADIGEIVERLRVLLAADHGDESDHCIDLATTAAALLTDRDDLVRSMREVAERLSEQRDEPWPGGTIAERLHYWRDKAIKAADDLRAALKVLDGPPQNT